MSDIKGFVVYDVFTAYKAQLKIVPQLVREKLYNQFHSPLHNLFLWIISGFYKRCIVITAKVNNTYIGALVYNKYNREVQLFIKPSYRNKGIGSELIKSLRCNMDVPAQVITCIPDDENKSFFEKNRIWYETTDLNGFSADIPFTEIHKIYRQRIAASKKAHKKETLLNHKHLFDF